MILLRTCIVTMYNLRSFDPTPIIDMTLRSYRLRPTFSIAIDNGGISHSCNDTLPILILLHPCC